MRLILLQILTGYTIGSVVVFEKKILIVKAFVISTPFSKGIIKARWHRPIHITLICKNEYGAITTVGSKAVQSVFRAGLSYNEIQNAI